MDLSNLGYKNEPFILAKDVNKLDVLCEGHVHQYEERENQRQ